MALKKPAKKTYTPTRRDKMKSTKAAVTRGATEWWQREGKKMASARICERCNAVWYDGHWHTVPRLAEVLKAQMTTSKKSKAKPELCYECHQAVHGPVDASKGRFEGEVTLDGLFDAVEKAKVMRTVRNFGKRAMRRDPEDRIIGIDDRGPRVVVTTTENQMAAGLGKAVDSAFKGGKLRIVWSKDDLPVRVSWVMKA